jgi:RNA polymerase sigma-70 factor (family 1)
MLSHPPNLPDERILFARMAEGDEAAFSAIFFHYTAQIKPFIVSLTRSEPAAEEIVQEVFLSLWLNRAKLAGVENHRAYVLTASNNRVYSWLRKRARELRVQGEPAADLPDPGEGPEAAVDLKESLAIIEAAVERLPPQKKLIWRLSRGEGLSHDEIAQRLGLSKNTVKNHLVVAIKQIREELDKGGAVGVVAAVIVAVWEGRG